MVLAATPARRQISESNRNAVGPSMKTPSSRRVHSSYCAAARGPTSKTTLNTYCSILTRGRRRGERRKRKNREHFGHSS